MSTLLLAAESATAGAGGRVDLSGAWDRAWLAMVGGNEDLLGQWEILGLIILVGSLVMWLFRANQGGRTAPLAGLWPAVALGAVLVAPGVVIPVILELCDRLINSVVSLVGVI